jgi:hypothetical protein
MRRMCRSRARCSAFRPRLRAEIRILRRVQRRLAVACKVSIKEQIARNILDACLGHQTGQRVYRGDIERMKTGDARRVREGKEPLGLGIALHVADVRYGNSAVPRRVELSVIGHDQAAKMESLCKVLGVPLLVSPDFAGIHPAEWAGLGEHPIGGGDMPGRVLNLAAVVPPAVAPGGALPAERP